MKRGLRWTSDEYANLLQIVADETLNHGDTMTNAFEKVSDALDRSPQTVQNKFYEIFAGAKKSRAERNHILRDIASGTLNVRDFLESIGMDSAGEEPAPETSGDTTATRVNWSKEEEAILLRSVLDSLRSGGTRLEAFEAASEKLGDRSPIACAGKYNYMTRKLKEVGASEIDFIEDWLESYSTSQKPVLSTKQVSSYEPSIPAETATPMPVETKQLSPTHDTDGIAKTKRSKTSTG